MMSNTSKVAIILPSRGLIFSKTAEEILRAVKPFNHKFFFSHRLPIPECFEKPTTEALNDPEITHLLFVEDDMIIPERVFWTMLRLDKDVVTCDYPVTKEGQGAVLSVKDEVIFSGTGCLLVKREVFNRIKSPYFRDDVSWNVLNLGTSIKLIGMNGRKGQYGNHDVTFSMKLYKAGIPITLLNIPLGQRKLLELGKSGTNDGAHKTEEWTKIKKDLQLKRVKSMPLALETKSRLVTVDTPTGGINTTKKHADNLVKQGMAVYPKKKAFILDDSEVEI